MKDADTHKAEVVQHNIRMEEAEKRIQELQSRITALEFELGNRRPIDYDHTPKIAVSKYDEILNGIHVIASNLEITCCSFPIRARSTKLIHMDAITSCHLKPL